MPRFVLRVGYGLGVILLVSAAAGIGFGLLRTSWRGQQDDLTRSARAYAGGDFRRAAELARNRLKDAPDDREALRLLARATARLGRDAPANALFARLGSADLQAEDLYLLGLGLDRAGQKEAAGRVWETGPCLTARSRRDDRTAHDRDHGAESPGGSRPPCRAVGPAAGLGAPRRARPGHIPIRDE